MAEVTWNLSILTFVLYTFVGTAVAHNIMSALKLSRYVIFGFYITLFLIPHLLIPVALVGVSDAWWKLREKMAAKKH
jgi:mannose/fructose/N-acetylgalactosamine-specific phosphotransferase system component IIC